MSQFRFFAVLTVLTAAVPAARSETIQILLPQLNGSLPSDGPPILATFDAGVSFSSIEQVRVDIQGIPHPGIIERFNARNGTTTVSEFSPQILAGLPGSPTTSPAEWFRPVDDDPGHLTVTFGSLQPHLDGYFFHLLDGQAELRLSSTEIFGVVGFDRYSILESSLFEITSVEMTIDGTIQQVPEPGTFSLLATCLSGLATGRRRRSMRRTGNHQRSPVFRPTD